jgi:hypothetical protein
MAHIDDSLKAVLYRITCPDGATLGNYHLGFLPEAAAAAISTHLAICPHCTQEVAQLELFLAETAVATPSPTPADRIKIWLAKQLPTGGQAGEFLGTPAFAMRGGDTGPLMFEAGDAQLSFEVQDDPEHPGHKAILGLVLGIETEAVEVQLIQNEVLVTAVSLDPIGNFTISNVQQGEYALILSGPTAEIHVPSLEI